MPQIPSRKELESFKRTELQKLCKDYGVKANLKTENLIDLLLETKQPNPRVVQPVRNRSTSTRHSSRAIPRNSSMIVHDTDDELESDDGHQYESLPRSELPQPVTLPRTRKAKETQKRLGVGRPVAAGGSGPRAITKSLSVSRKSRGGRSANVIQETITEEPEETAMDSQVEEALIVSPIIQEAQPSPGIDRQLITQAGVQQMITESMRPLQEQVRNMKTELAKMQSLQEELFKTKAKLSDIDVLQKTVEDLREEVETLRKVVPSSSQTALLNAEPLSSDERLDCIPSSLESPLDLKHSDPLSKPYEAAGNTSMLHPGFAAKLIGKRHRDSTASTIDGVISEDDQDQFTPKELAKQVLRPNKKKARLVEEDVEVPESESSQTRLSVASTSAVPDSTDKDYVDPPPPTNPLPRFFGPPESPPPRRGVVDKDNHPFSFSFMPVPTSPPPFSVPNFTYPDPPQSPTPAGHHQTHGFLLGGRPDLFQFPGTTPSRGKSSTSTTITVNPLDIGTEHQPDDICMEVPGDSFETTSPGESSKKTMYGTELDGDSRFGDFGLEGVASFWAGGRF